MGLLHQQVTAPAVQWQDAKPIYKADRCDLARSTVKSYYDVLDRFFAAAPDITQAGRMTILTYMQQFDHWATYNFNLAAIKSFFAWAADFYGFVDPAVKLKSRHEECLSEARFVTEPEYRLIGDYHGYGRDIAVFLGNTGLRAQEFIDYRPAHIGENRVLTVFGKGRKMRKVPLNQTAWQILCKYNFAINLKKNGKYMTYTNLRYRMEHLSKKLNLELFRPHSLRHYFATALISRGANIADVSKLLGHANINITIKLYYHPQSLDCVSLLDA